MSEIKPALTAEQWAKGPPGVFGWDDGSVFVDFRDGTTGIAPGDEWEIVAAANDALPDDDPRKITRARLALLAYETEAVMMPDEIAARRAFITALAALLPPE